VTDVVDPGQRRGPPVLAEQVNIVAQPGQRPGQARVVDVAAGPTQQVAVEDEDADAAIIAASPDMVSAA
jgi:hypothetical protein